MAHPHKYRFLRAQLLCKETTHIWSFRSSRRKCMGRKRLLLVETKHPFSLLFLWSRSMWMAPIREFTCDALTSIGGGTFFKVGGNKHKRTLKNYRKFLWFELATVTSQALKYYVITYTPYEGLNYTISDKTTPLWKRIGEPPEIQIGCYRGDPSHQRHSGSSYDLFWLTE